MGMEAFYTRDKANDGIRVDLHTPDGKPSGEWLMVRHAWSDAFVEAEEAAKLRVANYLHAQLQGVDVDGDLPPEVKAGVRRENREARLDLLASLVSGWSFPDDCTQEAAREFLARAPQIAAKVDKIAGDTERFFGSGKVSSARGSRKRKN